MKFLKNYLVVTLAALAWKGAYSMGMEHQFCDDLRPQNDLDIHHLMGMWYGVEIITHLRDDHMVMVYNSCPIVHLSEVTYEPSRGVYSLDDPYSMASTEGYVRPGGYGYSWDRTSRYNDYRYDGEYRHLRLIWDESGNNIEYHLKFNQTRKGFWMMSGPQNAKPGYSSTPTRSFNQFTGTVQVLKAVVDHLVLTFCNRLPRSQLFSIILSREPLQLSRHEIHGIHNLLNRRELSTSTVRKVCNGAYSNKVSISSTIIFTIISIITCLKIYVL